MHFMLKLHPDYRQQVFILKCENVHIIKKNLQNLKIELFDFYIKIS